MIVILEISLDYDDNEKCSVLGCYMYYQYCMPSVVCRVAVYKLDVHKFHESRFLNSEYCS